MLKSSVVLAWVQAGRVHAPAKEAVPLANGERAIIAGVKLAVALTPCCLQRSLSSFGRPSLLRCPKGLGKRHVREGWRAAWSMLENQNLKVRDALRVLMPGHIRRLGTCSRLRASVHATWRLFDPGPSGSRGSCTFVLGQLRRLLVQVVGGIAPDVVADLPRRYPGQCSWRFVATLASAGCLRPGRMGYGRCRQGNPRALLVRVMLGCVLPRLPCSCLRRGSCADTTCDCAALSISRTSLIYTYIYNICKYVYRDR